MSKEKMKTDRGANEIKRVLGNCCFMVAVIKPVKSKYPREDHFMSLEAV